MNRYNFLPEWYIKNKMKRKRIMLAVIIIVLLCFNLLLVKRSLNNNHEILQADKKIEALNNKHNNFINKKNKLKINKDTISVTNLNEFVKFIPDYITLKNAEINNNTIHAKIFVRKYDDYITFLQYIEEKNIYNISRLTPAAKENEGFSFEIIVEKI